MSKHTDAIRAQLTRCIAQTSLDAFGPPYHGKVRDTVAIPDGRYIIVASDRISAFDHVLRQQIPFKGQVLNQIAAYFFEATSDLVPNHVLAVPDPNVTIGIQCEIFPIEFVMRGYLAGHAWRTYKSGGRILCGETLPGGLRQNSKLPEPILTPATKAVEGHDLDISKAEIVAQGIIPAETLRKLEDMAQRLFAKGAEMAHERGLILVDTKYEFGRTPEGSLVVVDEVHTPDSSRYFYADTYDDLLAADAPQRQLSKEFVREWLMANGFQGKTGQVMPDMPDDFRMLVSERYIELYEAITGRDFIPDPHPDPQARILQAVQSAVHHSS